MRIKSKLLSVSFAIAILPFISANPAQASDMCTVKTAKESVSSSVLCGCGTVSSLMLKYIQRRADFEEILERTSNDCPAFAAVLTDLPTASLGFAERRRGDGPAQEERPDRPSSGPSRNASNDSDPGDSTPGGEDKGDDKTSKDKKSKDKKSKDKKSKDKKSKDKKSKDKKAKNKKSKDKKSKNKKSKNKKSKDKKSKNKNSKNKKSKDKGAPKNRVKPD
ncbi:hypothetical protein [Ruegeria sp. ANG-R]|uniref:hypothetical protein n=1 Tax=Ruegeria sp. ANG-R TaxID=1577903 RepID=UPI000AEC97D7|nr:hypothetical protein [Ruegeria sp. ANG-R]